MLPLFSLPNTHTYTHTPWSRGTRNRSSSWVCRRAGAWGAAFGLGGGGEGGGTHSLGGGGGARALEAQGEEKQQRLRLFPTQSEGAGGQEKDRTLIRVSTLRAAPSLSAPPISPFPGFSSPLAPNDRRRQRHAHGGAGDGVPRGAVQQVRETGGGGGRRGGDRLGAAAAQSQHTHPPHPLSPYLPRMVSSCFEKCMDKR